MSERKIDIYNHVMPRTVADRIRELAPGKGDMVKRATSIPMLYDIEARVRMMDQWPGYQQVLTLSSPPIETIAGPGDTPDLARVANDELKKICEARPDKFPAWVASLPLNAREGERASLQGAAVDTEPAARKGRLTGNAKSAVRHAEEAAALGEGAGVERRVTRDRDIAGRERRGAADRERETAVVEREGSVGRQDRKRGVRSLVRVEVDGVGAVERLAQLHRVACGGDRAAAPASRVRPIAAEHPSPCVCCHLVNLAFVRDAPHLRFVRPGFRELFRI